MQSDITIISTNWSHMRSLLRRYFPTQQHKCAAALRNHFSWVGRGGAAVEVRRQMLWEHLGPEALFYFCHCGTGSTLCRRKDTCNQPLTPPSHFESLSAGLRAGANPHCVYRTTDPTAGCPVCSLTGTLLVCGFIWMMCPHLGLCFFFFPTAAMVSGRH